MINKRNILAFLFLSITLLFSCTLNNEPGKAENENSVLFNLVANRNIQELYLYRTAELKEDTRRYFDSLDYFDKGYSPFFIKGASIELVSDNLQYNSFFVVKDESLLPNKGYKYINSDSVNILPNTKYSLSINYDDITIFGETTTPATFKIISPKNNTIIYATDEEKNVSFRAIWAKSKKARGYIITIVKTSEDYYSSTSYITADTTFNIKQNMSWGNYRLEILAYDKNFHNYIVEEYNQSGLENAYGYFSSSVLKYIDFEVKY